MDIKYVKPPLGIMPRHMWEQERIEIIAAAIERFLCVGKEIPLEWVDEYNFLAKRHKE